MSTTSFFSVAPGISLERRRTLGRLGGLAAMLLANGETVVGAPRTGADTEPPPRAERIIAGLDHPWGLDFLPDGRLLITERPGRLRIASLDGRLGRPISGLPPVVARGQGGLLDVTLAPDYAASQLIYWSYSEPGSGAEAGRSGTSVARGRLLADQGVVEDVQVIFRQRPKVSGNMHYGSRLVFDRKGMLFVTLGERHDYREQAQNPMSHLGKIVRIRPDGGVPSDNPFVGKSGWLPEIWSLGHRNVQGAALHPETGELWISEHGPQGGDEVNIVRAGHNYGWPVITYGCEYVTCLKIGEGHAKPGMDQPVTWWMGRSIAPSGICFYSGKRFPQWRGNLLIGALAGQALWRVVLDGERVLGREPLFASLDERIRTVKEGRAGVLYLLTDRSAGQVIRLG